MRTLSDDLIAKELARRKRKPKVVADVVLYDNFPKQNAFVEDPSRFLAAQCSRRAGKSNGLALRFLRSMKKYPNSQCLYLALTRESAKDIMWPTLQEMNERYTLGLTFIESRLTIVHPNGAKLLLYGADMKNFIKRLKGRKFPGVGIDEAQDFGVHLQSLVDDVLTPSVADYSDGWLALTRTPGPVPHGYFFNATHMGKYGYSLHDCTLFDNTHMPDAKAFVQQLIVKREWEENNPTLLREYYNKWVLDVQSLWVRYKESINHYEKLPDISPAKYNYILGIDLGFRDADALAVLAWSEKEPVTYLVEEVITQKQGITELVQQITDITKKYDISKMVIDEGGLGKKIAEEIRRQHHIPVQPADKMRKQENVEFLNDALRVGRFKAKSSSRFAQDSYLIQIDWEKSTPDKIVIKKLPHSDIIDSVLYAHKESPAFAWHKEPAKPKYGTKEWAENQETEMFEHELELLQAEQEISDRYKEYE